MNEVNVSQPNDVLTYNLIKKALDASNVRAAATENNIANVNTKGYKSYHVSFEDSLKDSVNNLEMRTTRDKHMQNDDKYGTIGINQDETTSMKSDGNNVDIDYEMTELASNYLMYSALTSQLDTRYAINRYVIEGGK